MKALSYILLLLVILILGWYTFSPFGANDYYPHAAIVSSVDINAPASQVFEYLGDSDNASEWSSFVHHISPLNVREVPDGAKGSLRRCFKNADESGEQWDEEILIVEPGKRRRLSCFNVKNFSISTECLLTEQRYEDLGQNRCRLTFTLFMNERALWSDYAKMYAASYRVASIFKNNLQNIKRINE